MKAPAKPHPPILPTTVASRRGNSIEALEARIAPAANVWIGQVSGLWTDPANWSDGVPTADDDVTINPAGALTITIPTGAQVANSLMMLDDDTLQITGGSLTLTSASTLSNLTFSNGTLNAGPQLTLSGSVSFSGEATIAGKVRNDADFTLTGTPNLSGTIDNVGVFKDSGRLDFSGAGQFNNLAGGIFEAALSGGGSVAAGTVAVPGFFNAGIFRLSQTGSTTFGVPFSTAPGGVVEVTSGTLNLTGGGTWDGANLQIAQGAEVSLTSGSTNLTGLLSGTGQGVFRLGGGIQGASEGAMLLIGAGGLAVNFPIGRFEFSGNATIAGGTFLNQGLMTILDRPDLHATLDNAGTVQHSGSLGMSDDARINNLAGGVYEILSVLDNAVAAGSGVTPGFFNSGTVRYSAAAPSSFNINFSNLTGGVIEGKSSELAFNRNGTWENTNFVISPGAEVTLSGGNVNWAGNYTGSGGGLLRLGRGTQGASEGGHVTVGAGGATFDFPAGFFEFSGNATLDGGTVNSLGQITIADRPDLGTTINNPGTIINRGQLDFGAAGQINNLAGGILELANVAGGAVTNSASAVPGIFNAGTVRLTEAAGATISVPFSNQIGGVIEVTAGTLALHSSGTWEGGNFVVSSGSVVTLNAGDKVWSGTYTGSGGGILRLGGGKVSAGVGGATLNFPNGFFEFSGNATLDGGEVTNLGGITIAGRPDLGTTIDNTGTITIPGQLDVGAAGRINNQVGGVLEIAKVGGGTVASGGAAAASAITNAGTIRLTEAGVSTIAVPFDNLAGGVIEVTAGTLALHSAGTWEGANFLIAAGSEVTMNAGDKVWSGTYTGSGGGILRLGGGTQGASAGGLITISSGGATMNFPPGFFLFTNNANLDGGSIDNQGEISMSVRPNLNLTINNAGTIVDTGGIDFGAAGRINNLPSGTINIANTADGTFASGGLGIFNQGTFVLTTPFNLATSVPFSNTGLVKAGAGTLRITGTVAEIVNGVLTDGTWEADNGASFLVTRPFSTNAATLIQHGSGIVGSIGAGLTTNQGTLQLRDASSLTLTQDFTNSGRLVIDSGSLLTASGAFSQTSAGRTEFELAGTQASGEYGRLAIGGTAALDGTAAFVLEEGFTPQIGDSYGLVTFAGKSGAIASYEGTKISRNLFLSPLVSDTSLVINVVDTPANAKLLDGKTPVTFTDADGDTVTIKLKGPGSARVVLLGDVADNADIDFIAIQAATDKTSLKVAVKRKGAGDGLVGVGSIDAAGVNLKTVSIKGDLGQITAGDGSGKPAVKSLLVAGDFGSVAGVATFSQLNGGVKKFNIGGAFDGGSLQVDGAVGSVAIGGNFEGSPVPLSLVGSIAENGLHEMVAQGQALPSGVLLAESIHSLKVGGSVKGGAITTSKDMGNVSVFGDLGAALFSGGGMKSVKVVGKVASADPINPATITPRTKIDSLVIGDDVVNARILVGYDKDEQPVNPDAQVGKVVVKGDWIASSLVAGIVDITADGFGRNDVIIAGDTTPSVFSRIASLTIKGAVSGSPAAGDHFGITAQQIGKVKIGGVTIPLSNDVADDVLLDATNADFRVVEVS